MSLPCRPHGVLWEGDWKVERRDVSPDASTVCHKKGQVLLVMSRWCLSSAIRTNGDEGIALLGYRMAVAPQEVKCCHMPTER